MVTIDIVLAISPTPYREARVGGWRLSNAPLAAPLMRRKMIRGARRPCDPIQTAMMEMAIRTIARHRLVSGPTLESAKKPKRIRPRNEARLNPATRYEPVWEELERWTLD
jgi:hypothetical protein